LLLLYFGQLLQVLSEAPPAVSEKQTTKGDFVVAACAAAVREGIIEVPEDVRAWFKANPSLSLCSLFSQS
jgi:hypothetical protein